jgi:hypothetical protein
MFPRSQRLLHALIFFAAAGCSRPSPPPPPSEVTCAQTTTCSQSCPANHLADCVADCGRKIGKKGQPYWQALQECSRAHCENPCVSPKALACKLCVMGKCASETTGCLAN